MQPLGMISQGYLKGYLIGKVSEPNSVFEQCILVIHLTEELLKFVDFLINSFSRSILREPLVISLH